MRGELIHVWDTTWAEIWSKLLKEPDIGEEVAADLYRELVPEPTPPDDPEPRELNEAGEIFREDDIADREGYEKEFEVYTKRRALYDEVASGSENTRDALRDGIKSEVRTEMQAVLALEAGWRIVESYGSEAFSNRYFLLVDAFLKKYSLRYDLRRPFSLHTTLPGIFATLISQLRHAAASDEDLSELMHEFDEAVRDLKNERTSRNIKVSIQKQINLLEGLAVRHPRATRNTLGGICDQTRTWPHSDLKEATKALYRFTCDYPGIRHAGNPAHRIRAVDMRDMVAVSIILAGCMPYLTETLDYERVFSGGEAP